MADRASRVQLWLWGCRSQALVGAYGPLKLRCTSAALVPEVVEQVDKDLRRLTLPAMQITQALRSVLLTYSLHDPAVGYCQGMHCVTTAALLPDVCGRSPPGLLDEENAFAWLRAYSQIRASCTVSCQWDPNPLHCLPRPRDALWHGCH